MQVGDSKNAISSYLDYASIQPEHIQIIYNELIRFTTKEDDIEELQRQLYGRIQSNNEQIVYTVIF